MPTSQEAQAAQQQMARSLRAMGVRTAGVLLVHASLKSLGPVPGGAATVVAALRDALGPEGTLLMPSLCYKFVGPTQPVFDVLRTPSCVGWLSEWFRQQPETIRSLHPTHSVCAQGPRAVELAAGAELDRTPCGPHSAFSRLREVGGQVLFLGCGMNPNTSMHAIEEHVDPSYLWGDTSDYQLILQDGGRMHVAIRNHNPAGWPQHYSRVAAAMPEGTHLRGPVLSAECHLLDAPAMWAAGLRLLRRDPLVFTRPDR